MMDVVVKPLVAEHIDLAYELEAKSYPADEAASLEGLRYRQANAPDFFMGNYSADGDTSGQLLGYVCGTCTTSDTLDHHSMSHHDTSPAAQYLCIHSVVTAPHLCRKGYGTALLRTYLARVWAGHPELKGILLVAKLELVGFYERVGFVLVGPSALEHGADTWYELRMTRPVVE